GQTGNDYAISDPGINFLETLGTFPTDSEARYQFVDFDGNGEMDIVSFSSTSYLAARRIDVEVKVHNIRTGTVVSQSTASADYDLMSTEPNAFKLLNLDSDPAKELLIYDSQYAH